MNKKKTLALLLLMGVVAIIAISLRIWWVEKTYTTYFDRLNKINEQAWAAVEDEPVVEVTVTFDNGDKMTFHGRYSCTYSDRKTKALNLWRGLSGVSVCYTIVIAFLFIRESIKKKH